MNASMVNCFPPKLPIIPLFLLSPTKLIHTHAFSTFPLSSTLTFCLADCLFFPRCFLYIRFFSPVVCSHTLVNSSFHKKKKILYFHIQRKYFFRTERKQFRKNNRILIDCFSFLLSERFLLIFLI
jgi:hypothetical protein